MPHIGRTLKKCYIIGQQKPLNTLNSNFHFLREGWPRIYETARTAEQNAIVAPVTGAIYARMCLELMVDWLYQNDQDLDPPYQSTLSARLKEDTFQQLFNQRILRELNFIRKGGNLAVHSYKSDTEKTVAAIKYLHHFCRIVYRWYSEVEDTSTTFIEDYIPRSGPGEKSRQELARIREEFDHKLEALETERNQRELAEAELDKLRAELATLKERKEERQENLPIPEAPLSEAETRRIYIDQALQEAGWDPAAAQVREYPVHGMPKSVNASGTGKADYVLWGDDGRPLAVVEAKRTSADVDRGKYQARAYADALEQMHGRRPVIFFTNGYEIYCWDDAFDSREREVAGFFTREELALMIQRRTERHDPRQFPVDPHIAGRPYQQEAIQRVLDTYTTDYQGQLRANRRAALVVMATGAGKTRTSTALVDILVKANWVKRVLFLADRKALVKQAKKAYGTHLPRLSGINLTEEDEDHTTRLVFSTYPTMMNRIDSARKEDGALYTPGHFDLIIVDEAHRSVYQKYRAIFAYFDALLLGLTATPREEADKDTYELFGHQQGDPAFAYELEEAVGEGYLVPPRGKEVDIQFLRKGIKYKELSETEKAEYEATFRDEEGQMPEEISAKQINQRLFNHDTIVKVIETFMEQGIKVEGGDKIGKTIVFARNHKHAKKTLKVFYELYPHLPPDFCVVIDHHEKMADSLLENFEEADQFPQIAISVDMLDTGIDIHEIVNLVFFKPVYSYAKYWQMIGRGTRLCPDLFGPGQDKTEFYVFDFCGNFAFFEHNPQGIQTSVPKSLSHQLFAHRLQLALQLQQETDTSLDDLRHELLDHCYEQVRDLHKIRDTTFRIRQQRPLIDEFADRTRWSMLSYDDLQRLTDQLGPLVGAGESPEQARRFDLLVLQAQLFQVDATPSYSIAPARIQAIAQQLSKLGNVPAVRNEMTLIRQLTQKNYLQELQDPVELDRIRTSLRNLVHIIPKQQTKPLHTNFTDTVIGVRDSGPMQTMETLENYRQRVNQYLQAHTDHLAIRKLRNNTPITLEELDSLEELLFSEEGLGSRERYQQVYADKPIGHFIRSVLGMEEEAVKVAFGDFLNRTNLRADQIQFLRKLVQLFTTNGILKLQRLQEAPFTTIHDMGLFGIFPDEGDQRRIVEIIREINRNAG